MALCSFDLGCFEQLHGIFQQSYKTKSTVPINNLTNSESYVAGLNNSDNDIDCKSERRRQSLPQIIKSPKHTVCSYREQRITSVIGVPHRHHITIAVNDEPVDVIKTTCTGPCLQACHTSMHQKKLSNVSSINSKTLNELSDEKIQKSLSRNIIVQSVIYLLSFVVVRIIVTSFTSLFHNRSTNKLIYQIRKMNLFIFYLLLSLFTYFLTFVSINNSESSLINRLKLFMAIICIIIWSSLNLIYSSSFVVTFLSICVLTLAISLFWDSHIRLLKKWSNFTTVFQQNQLINKNLNNNNNCNRNINLTPETMMDKVKVYPILSIMIHSLHIWSNLIIFVLIESLQTASIYDTDLIKSNRKSGNFDNNINNNSTISSNYSMIRSCGFDDKPLYAS